MHTVYSHTHRQNFREEKENSTGTTFSSLILRRGKLSSTIFLLLCLYWENKKKSSFSCQTNSAACENVVNACTFCICWVSDSAFFCFVLFYYMKNLIKGRERKTKTEKNRHLQQKGLYQNINKEELANNRA